MPEYDKDDLQSVLTYMRERFGAGIFEEPPRMFSIMKDLSPQMKSARNILRQLSEAGLCAELSAAMKSGKGNECSRVLMKSKYWLKDNLDLSDERADYYVTALNTVYVKAKVVQSGHDGNLEWTLYGDGALIISGVGNMENYNNNNEAPWPRESVQSVIIEDGVTSIGDSAFSYCSSLTSVRIPDSVTSIGYCAFGDCRSLTSVSIPDSVTSIGYCAFEYCRSLTSVHIPDSVTSIGDYAFYNCSRLTNVRIPDSVTSIGYYAFEDCDRLTSVSIPDSVTSIGDSVFYNCFSLTNVRIPDSVTSIGDYAFYNCLSLTNVRIPDSVTSIGDSTFKGCISLDSVSVPANAYISGSTFDWNTIVMRR